MNIIQHVPGTKIDKPGIYAMSLDEYHSQCCVGPSVSSSGLRKLFSPDGSPAHFWLESSLNPDREASKETEPMTLGRAAHHLLLGEGEFKKSYIIRPETYTDPKTGEVKPWNGNATACKTWVKGIPNGRTVITTRQAEQIKGMAEAIHADPDAPAQLRGLIEASFFWKDAETGIWLKTRPDCLPDTDATAIDLKCVSSISDRFIAKSIDDRGYPQQGALIGDGYKELFGRDLETFSLVFVEQDKPHCVRIESVAPEDYDRGWNANRAALRLLRKCLDANTWPGPRNSQGNGAFFNLSSHARERFDRRLERINQEIAA